jgi:hypothetical protein
VDHLHFYSMRGQSSIESSEIKIEREIYESNNGLNEREKLKKATWRKKTEIKEKKKKGRKNVMGRAREVFDWDIILGSEEDINRESS